MNDETWLPMVGERGWAVLTRDIRLRTRPAELDMVRAHRVVMFVVTSAGNLTSWDLREVLVHRWPSIERAVAAPGPAIYGVTIGSLKALSLEPQRRRRARSGAPAGPGKLRR